MKTRFHPHALAAAAALGLGLPSANAQNPNLAPAAATTPATAGAEAPAPAEKRFDIELASGAVAEEVVTRLTQLAGRPLNVVWSGNSAATELPALRLHQVTLQEFFAAISAVGQAELEQGRPGYRFSEVPNAENIYTFAVLPPSTQMIGGILASTTAAAPKTSRFFDLSALLTDTLTIDDITTAVRAAWTAAAGGDEPPAEALKYHQETQMLIATGQQKHLETVESIVELLQRRSRPSQSEKDTQIAELKSELEATTRERNRVAVRADRLEQESDAQLRELKTKIAELEIELAKASKNP